MRRRAFEIHMKAVRAADAVNAKRDAVVYLPCDACGVTRPVGVVLDGGVYTLCVECLAESLAAEPAQQPTGDERE